MFDIACLVKQQPKGLPLAKRTGQSWSPIFFSCWIYLAMPEECFLSAGFHRTCIFFSNFWNLKRPIFCFIYLAMNKTFFFKVLVPTKLVYLLSFLEIKNIPRLVIHKFCLIYPSVPEEYFPSFDFHMTFIFVSFWRSKIFKDMLRTIFVFIPGYVKRILWSSGFPGPILRPGLKL